MRREERARLDARRKEFVRCGEYVVVRQCGGCGVDRAGSGFFNRSCKARACPACAWKKAKIVGQELEKAFDVIEAPKGEMGWGWRFIVVTIKYDPSDPWDLSVAGLRSRARLAVRLSGRLWKDVLKAPGAAMLRSVECGARGHVHLNLIYFGPEPSKAQLHAAGAAVDCRVGWIKIKNLDYDPGRPGSWRRKKAKDRRGEMARRR
jgi:hypothetical protein